MKTELKKESKGVYSFLLKGERVFVRKMYTQGFNKNRSEVKRLFTGWGINETDTYPTLKEFRQHYSV